MLFFIQAGTEFNNQVGSNMQADRGSAWMSAPPENPALTQLSAAPPLLVPGQMGPSNQSARPPSVISLLLLNFLLGWSFFA